MSERNERITFLNYKRGNIKRHLTNYEHLLDSITAETDIESLDLETRLNEKHLPILREFEGYQDELDLLTESERDKQINADERSSVENRYYLIIGRIKQLIRKGTPRYQTSLSNTNSHSENNSNAEFSNPVGSDNDQGIREFQIHHSEQARSSLYHFPRKNYPDLKIPNFSGNFETWLGFYDSFNSMIHNDPNLPTIQKFHYLKGCLTGDAANIITSLETTNENYSVAWDLLKNRYHNKRFIIDSHVKALFEITAVSKDFSIRSLYDSIQKHLRALRALSIDVDKWDAIMVHLIKSKLNNNLIEKWEESCCQVEVPSLAKMLSFLERRSQIEETRAAVLQVSGQRNVNVKGNIPSHHSSKSRYPFTGIATTNTSALNDSQTKFNVSKMMCYMCKGEHGIFACNKFLALSPKDRYEVVQRASICVNCLRGKHLSKHCLAGACRQCGKRHNSLLHFNRSDIVSVKSSTSSNSSSQAENQTTSNLPINTYQLLIPSEVILATALVDIIDNKGNLHPCRVMLDGGSQPHVITERFVNKIGLKKTPVDIPLGAIDNLSTNIKYTTNTTMKSRYNNLELNLSLFVVKTIGNKMPTLPIDCSSFTVPQDLFLADPKFQTPADIDIILGAQYFYHLLGPGKIPIVGHPAVFQETNLGWVVAGVFKTSSFKQNSKVHCNFTKFSDLSLLWELDSPNSSSTRSLEEEACETHFIKTTRRDETGRYIVQLPFNEKVAQIGESRNTAFHRFRSLESKLSRDPALKAQYLECIQGYLKAGHMTLLKNDRKSNPEFFLPHHAVVKSNSLTTKTRVVFDGSCKSSSGISLNDALMVGPTIQDDLFTTFTRFRTFPFALTADIEQMYRQVQLHDEHRFFHKILWRDNPGEAIKIYVLNTVTFGTACAPFLAIRTLHQLAQDEYKSHPLAASILKRDFYVDDLLTGANTFEEAIQLRDDLIELLHKGGFNLRKWGSNDPRLVNDFPTHSTCTQMRLNPSDTIKTLGLSWKPSADTIIYTYNFSEINCPVTKRSIFSQAAKLFDPLGLLGPVIVVAKILIQSLWKLKLDWDTEIPPHLHKIWTNYRSQLPLLNHIQFKRGITLSNQIKAQLHGFCDASEKAYGACIYLRITDFQGNHHSSLVCSKSRVAPLKQTTLPRLELCAALLLAQLYTITFQSLNIQINNQSFWSDSTIALCWINSQPHALKTFVANRVAEIQTHTHPHNWKHVPTLDNPADYLSRGQPVHELLNNACWQHGPAWLSQEDDKWPQMKLHIDEVPEQKRSPIAVYHLAVSNWNLLEKYSSFRTLTRVMAHCLRFIHNIRHAIKRSGPLSDDEINASHLKIINLTQISAFSREIRDLSLGNPLNSKSDLLSLNPFLDKGIIRVGGRLKNALMSDEQKHPIVLPRNHYITKLIIREEHIKKMHAGTQATLYGVRESYWPIDGRNTTRHIVRKCVKCFRARPRGIDYIMGNLPEHRLFSTRPFLHVGVDYCGPFFIKEKRHRNRSKIKCYVSIFVCFATKAVHLELVSDLSTDAFIASLKRFFSRRGKAKVIHSDNGKNFVGAHNELKELYNSIQSTENDPSVLTFLINERVTWRFIPPQSPHFGGLWEASVKAFKHHLLRTVNGVLLTYEQLETFVIEIEAILNSRPLTPLSSDPNDLLPLTPGHFLIGSPLTSFPQPDLREVSVARLSCWQHIQQMRAHFWSRWQREYIHQMITRSKWQNGNQQDIVKPGTLVVIKEDNLPPLCWKLGRIVEVYPGDDKIVRVVTVRTTTGVYKRNVKRLYPLPILVDTKE